jgi:hypothetical protein
MANREGSRSLEGESFAGSITPWVLPAWNKAGTVRGGIKHWEVEKAWECSTAGSGKPSVGRFLWLLRWRGRNPMRARWLTDLWQLNSIVSIFSRTERYLVYQDVQVKRETRDDGSERVSSSIVFLDELEPQGNQDYQCFGIDKIGGIAN